MGKPLVELHELGPAALDHDALVVMVGRLVGADVSSLRAVQVEPVAYDVPAITTAARHWVRGEAVVEGTGVRPWSLFCKQVQAWERHPFFAFVPPEHREVARAGVPWRTEPAVYRSDLVERLPAGLAMPRAVAVVDLDELSAAVWLPELAVRDLAWDDQSYVDAARLLGRLAASPSVREVARAIGHRNTARTYLQGRLGLQVLPLLLGDELWQHPLLSDAFGPLRDRLVTAARGAAELTDELDALPVLASHGDASPGNLLRVEGSDDLWLIDFGFFGPMPVGFDLGQLLAGEVQLGQDPGDRLAERDAACVAAYAAGLGDEGVSVPQAVLHRAHALQLTLYAALSAVPSEVLDQPVTDELVALATARARLARVALDLLDATR